LRAISLVVPVPDWVLDKNDFNDWFINSDDDFEFNFIGFITPPVKEWKQEIADRLSEKLRRCRDGLEA